MHPYALESKLAERYLEGTICQGWMKEHLDDILKLDLDKNQFAEVSGDTYDWSLEIYLYGVDYKEFTLTKEASDAILNWGCSHFWINFTDSGHRYKNDEGREYYRCKAEIYVSPDSRTLKLFSEDGKSYELIAI